MMPVIIDNNTIGTTTNLSKFKNISPIGLIYSLSKFNADPAFPAKIDESRSPPSTLNKPRTTPIKSPAKILIESGILFFFSILILSGGWYPPLRGTTGCRPLRYKWDIIPYDINGILFPSVSMGYYSLRCRGGHSVRPGGRQDVVPYDVQFISNIIQKKQITCNKKGRHIARPLS